MSFSLYFPLQTSKKKKKKRERKKKVREGENGDKKKKKHTRKALNAHKKQVKEKKTNCIDQPPKEWRMRCPIFEKTMKRKQKRDRILELRRCI